ncbi:glycosyltransferase [Marinilabilia rubra]|uniref:Mannosyltransferase n=1 Tax=Marinilabilia rubra TaxID=2162893 RepID=A0A2U2B9G2_9BACT|nr:glycosyltransferase [Marinilabilia rubra]PWD99708.1 mannosyltransferase [Marinilabilia rubra]
MQNKTLHIVSLTIPYPANYGGVIDIWHKLKALHNQGINIILHCFVYNREPDNELERFCSKVFYYPRKRAISDLFSTTPFIIKSRENKALVRNLQADNYPILLEGVHCMGVLKNTEIRKREVWLRTHNVETHYYSALHQTEKNFLKKQYFRLEAIKSKRYESGKLPVKGIFSISEKDRDFFKSFNPNTLLITPFHGHEKVSGISEKGNFLLYHADLSVSENHQNATFLAGISNAFPLPLVIAGRNPSPALISLIDQNKNVSLRKNVAGEKMRSLIAGAAIILLPAKQTTGFRLKLLDSLFLGRHIIASPQMVEGTGLKKACHIATTQEEWLTLIKKLSHTDYSAEEQEKRMQYLHPFSDNINAQKIISEIF